MMVKKKRMVVLSGAGMSAESGIRTFRDTNGLWENHRIEDVATPEGWARNPARVLEFYNQRRRDVLRAKPNDGHIGLVTLESRFLVDIVTQNVDDLHERAGSTRVLHLHGEIMKARSTSDETRVYDWKKDLLLGDLCDQNTQLRPHIVWFGEMVPLLPKAAELVAAADIVVIIGTSLQVYPAAGLVGYAHPGIPMYYIDPNPGYSPELKGLSSLVILQTTATEGVRTLLDLL